MSVEEGETGEDHDVGRGGRWDGGVDPTTVEVARHRGARGEAGVRREPNDSRGGGRWFTGVDPMAVEKAVSEDPTTVEAWRRLKRRIVVTDGIVTSAHHRY
jgi:hypothetical protein